MWLSFLDLILMKILSLFSRLCIMVLKTKVMSFLRYPHVRFWIWGCYIKGHSGQGLFLRSDIDLNYMSTTILIGQVVLFLAAQLLVILSCFVPLQFHRRSKSKTWSPGPRQKLNVVL